RIISAPDMPGLGCPATRIESAASTASAVTPVILACTALASKFGSGAPLASRRLTNAWSPSWPASSSAPFDWLALVGQVMEAADGGFRGAIPEVPKLLFSVPVAVTATTPQ